MLVILRKICRLGGSASLVVEYISYKDFIIFLVYIKIKPYKTNRGNIYYREII